MRSDWAALASDVSTNDGITAAFYLSSKIPKKIESTQEGVEKLCSDSASYIYLPINTVAHSEDYIHNS